MPQAAGVNPQFNLLFNLLFNPKESIMYVRLLSQPRLRGLQRFGRRRVGECWF